LSSKNLTQQKDSGENLNDGIVHQIIRTLLKSNQTMSFAESCTGGLLSARIVEISGASAVYMGSVVSYSNKAKVEVLGVDAESLEKQGAVSQIVAKMMAQGVRHRFHTDWGVSITGIAGPTGGSLEKPVGTVWIAVSGASLASRQQKAEIFDGTKKVIDETLKDFRNEVEKESTKTKSFLFSGNRKQIQEQAVVAALEFLNEVLVK
jgi:nicotinamide-nucleotide amidase